jgi:hypothetical protein
MVSLAIAINILCGIGLFIRCYLLQQALAKARRESENSYQLWRALWSDWIKTRDQLQTARANRDLWRDKWKAGAFEMDAATLASLSEQDM